MPRKANPNSTAFLKRQVAELVAVVDAFADKLGESAKLLCEHEERIAALTEGLQVTEQERDQFRGLYHEGRKKVDAAEAEAKEARTARDNYRTQFESDRDLRRNAERERDLARAEAESMRRIAYPDPPQFPWEVVTTSVQVGPYDPATGMWRGN